MPKRLKSCPFCGSHNLGVIQIGAFHVECHECGAQGPQAGTWAKAEQLWSARRDRMTDGDGKH